MAETNTGMDVTGAFNGRSTQPVDNFPKLKLQYNGVGDVEEFLSKFSLHADLHQWTPRGRLTNLLLALRDDAFKVAMEVPTDGDDEVRFELLVRAVRARYGASPSANLAK